jgi:tagaturonate epimerase
VEVDGVELALTTDWRLLASGDSLNGLTGERSSRDGRPQLVAPVNHENLEWLRARLPWLRPKLLGLSCSAGFGDRLGLATPGHIAALRSAGRGIAPIFAQQSIREMSRSHRTPQQVLDDATWGVFAEGWRSGFGADADHLKTEADVDACAAAGYTFYTIDPGEVVWNEADTASRGEVRDALNRLPWKELEDTPAEMLQRHGIGEDEATRAAAKYGRAVVHVARLNRQILNRRGDNFELEVSVDETETPTTPAQHLYVAGELQRLGVRFVSFAPRFPGRFEKGVDFIGDIDEFEGAYARHAEIARRMGPYKLSLHSGSDKFSIYAAAARLSGRLVHLKTAGTSWLEALRTIGEVEPELLAEIYEYALARYPEDRASYHVSADAATAPKAPDLDDDACRQVLHVTFGSVLGRFNDRIYAVLEANRVAYEATIQRHFERHLRPFNE